MTCMRVLLIFSSSSRQESEKVRFLFYSFNLPLGERRQFFHYIACFADFDLKLSWPDLGQWSLKFMTQHKNLNFLTFCWCSKSPQSRNVQVILSTWAQVEKRKTISTTQTPDFQCICASRHNTVHATYSIQWHCVKHLTFFLKHWLCMQVLLHNRNYSFSSFWHIARVICLPRPFPVNMKVSYNKKIKVT